jgi:hypothetical protein
MKKVEDNLRWLVALQTRPSVYQLHGMCVCVSWAEGHACDASAAATGSIDE